MTIIIDLKPLEPYTGVIIMDIICFVVVGIILVILHDDGDITERGYAKFLLFAGMIIWVLNVFALGIIQFKT